MALKIRHILGLSTVFTTFACASSVEDYPEGGANNTGTPGTNTAPTGGTATDAGSTTPGTTPGADTTTGGGVTGAPAGGDTTGGDTATAAPPAGTAIANSMGWVDGAQNTYGIQGAFYTFSDSLDEEGNPGGGDSTIAPAQFTEDLCVSGTASQVDVNCSADDCYGLYWGAGVGLNLNQATDEATGEGGTPDTWDASANGVTGFSFTISGADVPSSLRFKLGDAGGEFCTSIGAGNNEILYTDLDENCWMPVAGATIPTASKSIQWQVATNDASTTSFDFCIENFSVLTN
ncbi:MAG: hypothetical protein MK135_12550 [Polyangiaceae bacterium]|nr:hypothetical protein [Polyangiaceae bacterium]